jgi:tripartite ATP-independent transporter DctP family solute receptor
VVPSRRSIIAGLVGSSISIWSLAARSQTFVARQYHPQQMGSHLHIYLTKLWDAVRKETRGQLDVTVFAQNNGAVIADPEILQQLQSGELEFFVLNGNILSQAHPSADIQGIPFAFTSSEQVTSLTDGKLGDLMRDGLSAAGVYLVPFGCMENGFKHITAVSKPIGTAADLEGFRMRTPGGKLFVEFYKALGADPRIVGFNRLYRALAEGQVDGQENPLVIAEENRLYEVCKYLSLTSHQWAGYNMIANNDFWRRLPVEIQEIVVRTTKTYVAQQRAFVRVANANLQQTLRGRGMLINTVDIESFRARLRGANFYRYWRESVGGEAWALMEAKVGKVG